MRDLKLWKFILQRLSNHQPVVLMCVVESIGSSPGRRGFKMAVAPDNMCGSIGGGIMEHKFVEMAKDKLLSQSVPLVKKQFHQKSASSNQSGMICSGEQTILMFRVDQSSQKQIQNIVSILEKNETGLLIITENEIGFQKDFSSKRKFEFIMQSEKAFEYKEIIGYEDHLYIIGGGHCALALSKLMHSLDFYIHLFEDREQLNTLLENNFPHEKLIVKDYKDLEKLIPPGEKNYVVVMTFGYRTDNITVRALSGKNLKYLGVLGSVSKMQQLFQEWRADGLPTEWLNKIYSPVGLQIKSETPEEIAVSIAAQIIQVKKR
jgi:xanthine dehydrogenase accessory factor